MATAGVIYMSYPLFTVVLAKLWLGQPMTGRGVIAGLLVVAAAAVALSPGAVPADALLPLLMSLPAPICFAVIIVVLSALVPALSVPERLACGMLGAVMGLLPVKLAGDLDRAVPSSGDGWLAILAMAGLTATLPQLLYTFAAPLAGAGRAAMTGSVELPTMFVIGWLAFGETLGSAQLVAGALVLLAIALAPSRRRLSPAARSRSATMLPRPLRPRATGCRERPERPARKSPKATFRSETEVGAARLTVVQGREAPAIG